MYCIKCGRDIPKPFTTDDSIREEDILWSYENMKGFDMVDNGVIVIADVGYGSKHDGDRLVIAVCDDCIQESIQDGTVLYYDNFHFREDDVVGKLKEESQKAYRRRKNLDKLI